MSKGLLSEWTNSDKLGLISVWAKQGKTDEEIASLIGISARTLYRWKQQSCQICQAIKEGKRECDNDLVAGSLFRRASGYYYKETTEQIRVDPVTKAEYTTGIKIVTKYQPPDVTAMIFWLKNRNPNEWSDRRQNVCTTNTDLQAIFIAALEEKGSQVFRGDLDVPMDIDPC